MLDTGMAVERDAEYASPQDESLQQKMTLFNAGKKQSLESANDEGETRNTSNAAARSGYIFTLQC
jgi:hypothetical protein